MERGIGVQVIVTAHNAEEHLLASLDSILPAVKNISWVFIFNSDGSTDKTVDIAEEFSKRCGADHVLVKKTKKAKTVGAAKNKTFKLINKFRKEYPLICVHDSDDNMNENRIEGLANAFKVQDILFAYGSFEYNSPDHTFLASAHQLDTLLKFGIWNTLFHEQLIPKSGKFFNEDVYMFEDLIKWWELRYKKDIEMVHVPDVVTTHYIKRERSMTKVPIDPKHIETMKSERNKIHTYPPIH